MPGAEGALGLREEPSLPPGAEEKPERKQVASAMGIPVPGAGCPCSKCARHARAGWHLRAMKGHTWAGDHQRLRGQAKGMSLGKSL